MTSGPHPAGLHALDRHGDRDSAPGMVDFAVNVRGHAPDFVMRAIAATLPDLARYPSEQAAQDVRELIAEQHGRTSAEVMLLAGAADGFAALPALGITHAALLQPSFTEPEIVLRAAGVAITQVLLDPSRPIDEQTATRIPAEADLVLIGNPTNPTSVLHPRAAIEAMRRPGRVIVVDEAFADLTLDGQSGVTEPESMADTADPDVVVIRSITKTFGLAGLRAGYLLAAPEVVARLERGRRAWPLSSPALAALGACASPAGQRFCHEQAHQVATERTQMLARLADIGITPCAPPAAPFVLIEIPNAFVIKESLRRHHLAVRSCANFVGLGDDHVRLAVRAAPQVDQLIAALEWARKENIQ